MGSYRGGSAYFIARAFEQMGGASTPIEVIDTFEGHPEGDPSAFDHPLHVAGHFSDTSFAEVRAYLEPFPNVTMHKGAFAEVAPRLAHEAYSFVHLDVDLYKPTKESLEYFSARLAIGGAIVLDDYGANKCPGIRKVADEFSLDHRGFHYWHPHPEQRVLIKTQLEP